MLCRLFSSYQTLLILPGILLSVGLDVFCYVHRKPNSNGFKKNLKNSAGEDPPTISDSGDRTSVPGQLGPAASGPNPLRLHFPFRQLVRAYCAHPAGSYCRPTVLTLQAAIAGCVHPSYATVGTRLLPHPSCATEGTSLQGAQMKCWN